MAADSNQAKLKFVEENSFAETPTSPTMTEARFTSESVSHDQDTTNSEEIRADRQYSDVIRTSVGASGDLSIELSYGSYDDGSNSIDFIGAALANTWNSELAISGTIGVDATNSQFTSDTSASGPDLSAVAVGQWIKTSGFTNTGNNGYFRVNAVDSASSTNTVTVDDPDNSLTDETGDGDEAIDGQVIFNGTTFRSFSMEKEYTDISVFDRFLGLVVGGMSLDISSNSQITGSFNFTGKRGESNVTSTLASSVTSANTTQVMNSIDHVAKIREGGQSTTLDTDTISFSIENNLRPLEAIGDLGATDVGLGTFDVTGSFTTYFESRDILDKFRDFTPSSLSFKLEDDQGNAYIFDFPQVKYTAGPVTIGGLDEFIMAELEWMAHLDSNVGKTMSITKF